MFDKVISLAAVCVGVLLIVGTKLQWPILVDPPEEWGWFYSHSGLKKLFGADILIPFNYVVGTLLVLVGITLFIASLAVSDAKFT